MAKAAKTSFKKAIAHPAKNNQLIPAIAGGIPSAISCTLWSAAFTILCAISVPKRELTERKKQLPIAILMPDLTKAPLTAVLWESTHGDNSVYEDEALSAHDV